MPQSQIIDSRSKQASIEYAKALRHMRIVNVLKYALPVVGILIISGLIAVSYVQTFSSQGVMVASSVIEDGKIVMREPVLTGQNDQNKSYRMQAERATQEIGNTSVITLENIMAELPVNDHAQAALKANSGILNQIDENLKLNEPFIVTTTSGIIARFLSAEYDIPSGNFISKDAVDIQMQGAHLTARKMKISNNGDMVIFEDNVKMIVAPGSSKAKENKAKENKE